MIHYCLINERSSILKGLSPATTGRNIAHERCTRQRVSLEIEILIDLLSRNYCFCCNDRVIVGSNKERNEGDRCRRDEEEDSEEDQLGEMEWNIFSYLAEEREGKGDWREGFAKLVKMQINNG